VVAMETDMLNALENNNESRFSLEYNMYNWSYLYVLY